MIDDARSGNDGVMGELVSGWARGLLGALALLASGGCGGQPELESVVLPVVERKGEGRTAASVLPRTPPSFAFCSRKDHPVVVDTPDESDLPEPTTDAGVFDIEQVDYRYYDYYNQAWANQSIAPAKLFYSFVPADHDAKGAPLFLFFNGGPGSGTTAMLRAHGTAPKTIDLEAGTVVDNPSSWSKLGNLLYVDARQAGFSYSKVPLEQSYTLGTPTFNDQVDAMDFVRALLALYVKFPALADNPLVVVGESYGGVRAQLILNALRDPQELETETNGIYVDVGLAQAISEHASNVAKRRTAAGLPLRANEEQFRWQVLIQPALVLSLPAYYSTVNRQYPQATAAINARLAPEDWATDPNSYRIDQSREAALAEDALTYSLLLEPNRFEELIGVAPQRIPGLSARERQGVKRFDDALPDDVLASVCPAPSANWLETMGVLGQNDCYYVPHCPSGVGSSASNNGWQNGQLFLKNLRGVHSFITRALLDSAVVSDFIPAALSTYIPLSYEPNPLATEGGIAAITEVTASTAAVAGVARAGHIDVKYRNGNNGTAPPIRRIRFPTYRNAGHMVAQHSPQELFDDVKEFLCNPETP